jgi:hypothetical protein
MRPLSIQWQSGRGIFPVSREFGSAPAVPNRQQRGGSRIFPVIFPVSREFGSSRHASSAQLSLPCSAGASCVVLPICYHDIREEL